MDADDVEYLVMLARGCTSDRYIQMRSTSFRLPAAAVAPAMVLRLITGNVASIIVNGLFFVLVCLYSEARSGPYIIMRAWHLRINSAGSASVDTGFVRSALYTYIAMRYGQRTLKGNC